MQKRVSTNPRDRIAGLAYLVDTVAIPTYDTTQSEEDAWLALINAMSFKSRAELLFLYPKPGNGKKHWQPSWEQVMTEMPLRHDELGARIFRKDETDDDCVCYSNVINSDEVRGLAKESKGGPRQGELIIEKGTSTRRSCPLEIIADHGYPIPDGSYTLLASKGYSHWVIGEMQEGKFKKRSVFRMADDSEREMLEVLGVGEYGDISLC
ncbi:uncharacterized protein EV420DRAFT_1650578 [Desarmillaria tabescens]|uniref:Uncharacterized protein n=1 Tax=Armillaria tabescens TaxID=1929756 RepID=A0AA39JDY3_ARMTA|nr:uncharacterized protein EV420DRAFT_1650578 [Desarmillaria tabescens]KAK0440190.1 hypothetical protein EV420DRAFT_1650578 [Desarmillaria tabescens]